MESSSQDRQLPATERKLQQARRDGQVARSRDLGHLAVLGTGTVAILLLAPWITDTLRTGLAGQLTFDRHALDSAESMLPGLRRLALAALACAAAVGFLVAMASLISTVAAGGWIASLKPITPDLKRINPLSGISNLLSKQQLTQLVKVCILAGVIGSLGWAYVKGSLHKVAAMVLQPSPEAVTYLANWLLAGVGLMLLVVLAVALVDVPLQTYFHHQRLRMSHQEVKQENRESEGDPHTKGRQRSLQRKATQRASITAVPRADVVLMNPTHYAVALRYDEQTMQAPQVISKGADLLAMRIRDVARTHGIPVIQSPMLARALYAHAEIDQPIPGSLYTAVAQVMAYLYRLRAALRGQGQMPVEPPDPEVPVELDPHHVAARLTTTEGSDA